MRRRLSGADAAQAAVLSRCNHPRMTLDPFAHPSLRSGDGLIRDLHGYGPTRPEATSPPPRPRAVTILRKSPVRNP